MVAPGHGGFRGVELGFRDRQHAQLAAVAGLPREWFAAGEVGEHCGRVDGGAVADFEGGGERGGGEEAGEEEGVVVHGCGGGSVIDR